MKWLWQLFWNPADALDWSDGKGGYDHGKVGSDLVIIAFVVVLVLVSLRKDTYPPVGWGIVTIAGAFGARVFIAFLRSRTVTSKEERLTLNTPPMTRAIDHPDHEAQ